MFLVVVIFFFNIIELMEEFFFIKKWVLVIFVLGVICLMLFNKVIEFLYFKF